MNCLKNRYYIRIALILSLFFIFFAITISCWGADNAEQEYETIMEELFGDGSVDKAVNEVLEGNRISVRTLIADLLSGESTVIDVLKEITASGNFGFNRYKEILVKLLGITISCALFGFLPRIFGNEQSAQMGHYISFIMLVAFLLTIFKDAVSIVNESIDSIIYLMNIIIPVFLVAVALAGGVTTAGISHELFVGIIYLVQKLIRKYITPAILIFLITGFANQLLESDSFSKLTNLIKKIISRILKTAITLLTGLQLLQGLITPYVDKFNTSFTGKAIEAIPGIGDLTTSGIEMAVGAALLVKNTVGVVAMIIIIAISVTPLLELLGYAAVLVFVNTLLQPVLEVRVQKILDVAVAAVKLLLQTLLTVILMFLISIALLAAKSGGGL